MKLAILNFSGNVGKTTIALQLLKPRIPGAEYLAIETINDGAKGEKKIEASEYGRLLDDMLDMDNLIIDIGSSNIETIINKIKLHEDSHEEFDYFIVPLISGDKQQVDTKSTLVELIRLGVKASKIRLIFNFVEKQEKIERDFEFIIDAAKKLKIRVPNVGIQENEVFEKLRILNKSIEEILQMEDLRTQFSAATDPIKKEELRTLIGVQRTAKTAKKNLDEVFKDLAL